MTENYIGEELVSKIKEKVPKLYSAFGNNEDGAVTQKFIKEKLNGDNLVLGGGASIQGGSGSIGTAIGRNATVQNGSLGGTAVGENATAGTASIAIGADVTKVLGMSCIGIGSNINIPSTIAQSVGIGDYAKPTRSGEVNIGTGSSPAGYNGTTTRILGGIHAGELDTDTVNVKQMKDYVAENAGPAKGSFIKTHENRYVYLDNVDISTTYTKIFTLAATTSEGLSTFPQYMMLFADMQSQGGVLSGAQSVIFTLAVKEVGASSWLNPTSVCTLSFDKNNANVSILNLDIAQWVGSNTHTLLSSFTPGVDYDIYVRATYSGTSSGYKIVLDGQCQMVVLGAVI